MIRYRRAPTMRLFLAGLVLAALAPAHDLWMIEDQGRLLIRIGEDFPVATNGITADRIVFWRLLDIRGALSLVGQAEEKQFAAPLPEPRGPAVVELEVQPRLITLQAPAFNRYIGGEGFDHVVAARRKAGADETPGREKYSRYSKLLVEAPGDDRHLLAPRGHHLEIVPEANPARLREGADLPVRILFEGQPLAGVWVSAGPAGMKGHQFPARARTDAAGRVLLGARSRGLWYVRLIHMIPSPDPGVEWRSFFATLTFLR